MTKKNETQKVLLDFSKMNPEKKAIIYNEQFITYFQFQNKVSALTSELKQLGVREGDYVAIHMSNSIEMILSVFAIIMCNAIIVPISIDMPSERISYILKEVTPTIIICKENEKLNITYESIPYYCIDYTKLDNKKNKNIDLIKYNCKDLIYCIFTSGSTGTPKGVTLKYEGILNHVNAKVDILKLTCNSRLTLSFDISFVASIWQILTPILLGAQLFIYDKELVLKPYRYFERLDKDCVDVVSIIPHYLHGYLQYIEGSHPKLSLSNMKYIVLTGEKVEKIIVERFYKNYEDILLINAYGQSECSDDTFHYEIPRNFCGTDIPIGKPIKNISYHILNEKKQEVASEEKGELYIGGICLAEGYLNSMKLTKSKFAQCFGTILYKTGDIVKKNQSDEIVYLGRADNQIKIHGYRIEPEEIEACLNQIEGIKQSVVVLLEVNEIDKILGACYISDCEIENKDIIKYLSLRLPSYMIPCVYEQVESFIENVNGKIDRRKTAENLMKKKEKELEIILVEKLTGTQKKIFDVIVSNFDINIRNNVSVDMDLKSIGLDSITFVKLIVSLELEFKFEFDDSMLLFSKYSTIKSIIDYVATKICI